MVKNVLAVFFIFALMFYVQLWLNAIRLEEFFFFILKDICPFLWVGSLTALSLAKKKKGKKKKHNSFFEILGLLKKLLCLLFLQGWVESKFQRSCFAYLLWNFGSPKLYKVINWSPFVYPFVPLDIFGYFIRSMKLLLIHLYLYICI